MRSENLAKAIGEIDDELIYSAVNDKPKANKFSLKKFIPFAACICAALVLIIPLFFDGATLHPEEPQSAKPGENLGGTEGGGPTEEGPPSFEYNGRVYMVSSYSSIENELPEGYTEAGTANIGGLANVPFFVNPDIPEYVYVYHLVYTNGEVDASNTLIPTEPHYAYVLYLDECLRGDDLIAYNGEMYISLWSADYYTKTQDVTEEYYNYYHEKYDLRIEGEAPEGFELAGTTVFTGHDTVPNGELASNIGEEEVYFNPDEPNVLLFGTVWHTVSGAHYGYNVYIKYDCPFTD